MDTNKPTAIYCRVSTEMQKERECVDDQRKRLVVYCERGELGEPCEYIDEGFSGGYLNRPSMSRLIEEIKNGRIATLVVTKIDRLTRDDGSDKDQLLDLFEKNYVRLIAIDEGINIETHKGDGYNDFNLKSRFFFSGIERDNIRSRVKKAMYHRAREGKWNGGIVPYGWTTFGLEVKKYMAKGYDKDHAPIEARKLCPTEKVLYHYEPEAKIYRLMAEKFVETNSIGRARDYLHENNCFTREGKPWSRSSITRLLRSSLYIGLIRYGTRKNPRKGKKLINVPKEDWLTTQGKHQPIISRELYEKIQTFLDAKKKVRLRYDTTYLLNGILKCGHCGCGLQGKSSRRGEMGKIHSYYRCYTRDQKGKEVCATAPVKKELVEGTVIKTLLTLYKDRTLLEIQDCIKRHNEYIKNSKEPIENEIEALKRRNHEIEKKKTFLWEKLESRVIEDKEFRERKDKLDREAEENEKKILEIQKDLSDREDKKISLEALHMLISRIVGLWDRANSDQRKTLLHNMIKEIRFYGKDKPLSINLQFPVGEFSRTGRDSSHKWSKIVREK